MSDTAELIRLMSPMDAGNAALPEAVVVHFRNPAQVVLCRKILTAHDALLEAAEDLANAVDWDRDILELDEDGYEAMRAKYDRNVDWINASVANLRAAIRQARGEQ